MKPIIVNGVGYSKVKTKPEEYKRRPCNECVALYNMRLCMKLPDCTEEKVHFVKIK